MRTKWDIFRRIVKRGVYLRKYQLSSTHFISTFSARAKLKEGSKEIKDEELVPIYSKIEQEWVKKPFKVKKGEKFKGTPMEAAAKIVKEFPLC